MDISVNLKDTVNDIDDPKFMILFEKILATDFLDPYAIQIDGQYLINYVCEYGHVSLLRILVEYRSLILIKNIPTLCPYQYILHVDTNK